MKKLIFIFMSLLMSVPAFAIQGGQKEYASPDGAGYVVTCSTVQSTELFTETPIEEITYKNATSGTIYLSTFSVTDTSNAYLYPLETGDDLTKKCAAFKYGIAADTTNATINLMITK